MNLTIAILDFDVCLYGGSELSKCLKMLAMDAKIIEPDPKFFMTDGNCGGSV